VLQACLPQFNFPPVIWYWGTDWKYEKYIKIILPNSDGDKMHMGHRCRWEDNVKRIPQGNKACVCGVDFSDGIL
jgi:hypothetical protein